MSADDTSDSERGTDGSETDDGAAVREKLEVEADRAIEQFDEGVVDVLSWILETETRARIYVSLRQQPGQTSDEIAAGTGLYPSTVREALAALHDEGTVERDKRESEGAGNNPYEYSAIPPSELVGEFVDDVQGHLNAVFNLDRYLDGEGDAESEPVKISVVEEAADEPSTAGDAAGE